MNHFRNDRELCRKDLLIKNVKKFRSALKKSGKLEEAEGYDFCPMTYLLPSASWDRPRRTGRVFWTEIARSGGVCVPACQPVLRLTPHRAHQPTPRSGVRHV